MPVRIAIDGYNQTALNVYCFFLDSGDGVEVIGWVGKLPEGEWPDGYAPPTVYPDVDALLKAGEPDLLFSTRGIGARAGTDYRGKIIDVGEGSAEGALFTYLASARETGFEHLPQVLRDIGAFCESVQVVDAYTDPLPKLNEILEQAMALCGADLGFVMLPGELAGELDLVVAMGEQAARFLKKTIRIEGSLIEAVMELGRSLLMRLAPEDLAYDEFLREAGASCLLAVPLQAGGRATGVLLVGRSRDEDFTAYHLGMLTVAAAHASLALQIADLYSELETNTMRDSASGLYNQHFFHSRLVDEVNRARRYSLNVCLLVLEVDDLEEYARRNGRVMTDFIIAELGKIIIKSTREVDVPARYSDNRFAVLLPETRRLGAMRLAERLCQTITEYPFPSQDKKEVEQLTACIGAASFPANADNETSLMQRAVLAMEAARAAGPGSARLYSDDLRK